MTDRTDDQADRIAAAASINPRRILSGARQPPRRAPLRLGGPTTFDGAAWNS